VIFGPVDTFNAFDSAGLQFGRVCDAELAHVSQGVEPMLGNLGLLIDFKVLT